MRVSLLRVAVVMAPVGILFLASTIMFARQRCMWAVLQLLGATGVVIVLLAHLCEAAQIFPWMQWGQEQSVGHYVDLSGAVLALVLFPLGHLLHALSMRSVGEMRAS